ncbi:MAG: GtrA family protein [Bacilli bacterium]
MIDNKIINNDVQKSSNPLWLELLLDGILVAAIAFLGNFFLGLDIFETGADDIVQITYSAGKYFTLSTSLSFTSLITAPLSILLLTVLMVLITPSGIKASVGSKGKNLISFFILSLFGVLAYLVIANLAYGFLPAHKGISIYLASLLVNIYEIFIYKLYFENRKMSNALFWELFRFAIVGLVAAVFDFAMCYLVQFVLFKDNIQGYVTIIATACGFIIGVIINYLMSTYMVYKASKSGFGKTFKGQALFLTLSVIGLLIGMGIQYVTYDILFVKMSVSFFSYPIDFVIRTLIVMVYNYITRKLFIYRK